MAFAMTLWYVLNHVLIHATETLPALYSSLSASGYPCAFDTGPTPSINQGNFQGPSRQLG